MASELESRLDGRKITKVLGNLRFTFEMIRPENRDTNILRQIITYGEQTESSGVAQQTTILLDETDQQELLRMIQMFK